MPNSGYVVCYRITKEDLDKFGNDISGGIIEIIDNNGQITGEIYTSGKSGESPQPMGAEAAIAFVSNPVSLEGSGTIYLKQNHANKNFHIEPDQTEIVIKASDWSSGGEISLINHSGSDIDIKLGSGLIGYDNAKGGIEITGGEIPVRLITLSYLEKAIVQIKDANFVNICKLSSGNLEEGWQAGKYYRQGQIVIAPLTQGNFKSGDRIIRITAGDSSLTFDSSEAMFWSEIQEDPDVLLKADNLSDLTDVPSARSNLGLGLLAVKDSIINSDITNDSVTYSKIQNISSTDKILGRSSTGSGDVEEINCTSFARSFLDDQDNSTARNTLDVYSKSEVNTNISAKENISNKITSLTSSSTDIQYPSAKVMYDKLATKSDTGHAHTITDVTNLQSSLDNKQSNITGAASSITSSNLTINMALVSDSNGKVASSPTISSTELGYLDGVTSNIQTQINSKQNSLVSGTNIKTINGNSLIGSGNIDTSSISNSNVMYYWNGLVSPEIACYPSLPTKVTGGTVAATWVNSTDGYRLTDESGSQSNQIYWRIAPPKYIKFGFKFKITNTTGSGADGMWFFVGADNIVTVENGTGASQGFTIGFSEWENWIKTFYGTTQKGSTYTINTLDDGSWHIFSGSVDNTGSSSIIKINLDGVDVVTHTDSSLLSMSGSYVGFGARTGGADAAHYIKGFYILGAGFDNL